MLSSLFGKQDRERVLPGHSTRELTDAKKRCKGELCAAIYLYDDSVFILSAIAGHTEAGEAVVLDVDVSDEALGETLCDKLIEYEPNDRRERPSHPVRDWAVFRASGARSGRGFEERSFYGYVRTINTAIRIDVTPRKTNHPEIRASCSLSNGQSHSSIGAAVRRAFEASKILRQAGKV
ncbi:MAG: hypothetical protein QNJ19_16090 [Woeseiaceae bacterium]|nr:hypothetical protein [Woeseiaceae bacterium]